MCWLWIIPWWRVLSDKTIRSLCAIFYTDWYGLHNIYMYMFGIPLWQKKWKASLCLKRFLLFYLAEIHDSFSSIQPHLSHSVRQPKETLNNVKGKISDAQSVPCSTSCHVITCLFLNGVLVIGEQCVTVLTFSEVPLRARLLFQDYPVHTDIITHIHTWKQTTAGMSKCSFSWLCNDQNQFSDLLKSPLTKVSIAMLIYEWWRSQNKYKMYLSPQCHCNLAQAWAASPNLNW